VSTITAVQQKLAQLGYYHGQIDGIAGPETQKAIRWFQSTDIDDPGLSDTILRQAERHSIGIKSPWCHKTRLICPLS
jgi:peptidoglycan hydrolase-like protein with peptidoglycan-binding domain